MLKRKKIGKIKKVLKIDVKHLKMLFIVFVSSTNKRFTLVKDDHFDVLIKVTCHEVES